MAKSKSVRTSATNVDRVSTNPMVQQWRAIRSEVSRVTWPTRQEAKTLTLAVTVGMVVMALFLYMLDALFQFLIRGIIDLNIATIIGTIIIGALVSFAFYSNSQED